MIKLERITALGNPCCPGDEALWQDFRLSRPHFQLHSRRLLDTVALKIRDYLFLGGDWSGVQDLPSHLKEKVLRMPTRKTNMWMWMFVERGLFRPPPKQFLIERQNGAFCGRHLLRNWRLLSE